MFVNAWWWKEEEMKWIIEEHVDQLGDDMIVKGWS